MTNASLRSAGQARRLPYVVEGGGPQLELRPLVSDLFKARLDSLLDNETRLRYMTMMNEMAIQLGF